MTTFDFDQQCQVTRVRSVTFEWKLTESAHIQFGIDDLQQNVLRYEVLQSMNLRTPMLRELLNPWPGVFNEQELAKPAPLSKDLPVPADVQNEYQMPDDSGNVLLKER